MSGSRWTGQRSRLHSMLRVCDVKLKRLSDYTFRLGHKELLLYEASSCMGSTDESAELLTHSRELTLGRLR